MIELVPNRPEELMSRTRDLTVLDLLKTIDGGSLKVVGDSPEDDLRRSVRYALAARRAGYSLRSRRDRQEQARYFWVVPREPKTKEVPQ